MRSRNALLLALGFAALATAVACGNPTVTDTTGGTATNSTGTPTPVASGTPGSQLHHPANYGDNTIHGPDALMQVEDCHSAGCHEADLKGNLASGGTAVSCDGCHTAGWRTNCTFCHGGTDNQTGAPPRDIDQNATTASLTFPAHTAHVTKNAMHGAFDCTQCHAKPSDALTPNHWFDATPGHAEVTFATSLSLNGTYNAATGTCSAMYCHGNGTGNNGTIAKNVAGPLTCAGYCHKTPATGKHGTHRGEGFGCYTCHGGTVNNNGGTTVDNYTIADATLHVNGKKDIKFTAGGAANMTYNTTTKQCSGGGSGCHGTKTW